MPELVAPAASLVCAEAAFGHGADAVYAGVGTHNLRAHAPNLASVELAELLDLAHHSGRKVYVVLNTMPDDRQLAEITELLQTFDGRPHLPDAFIVSDPGVLAACRAVTPSVALHLSTQTGTFNTGAIRFWKDQGVRRVILPRELALDQIRACTESGILETEIFIHGAMCVSVSGRCLLSAYLAGRHPNRGDCAQPCRLRYRIQPEPGQGVSEGWFDAEEDGDGVFLLNSMDLCALPLLASILRAGVSALKIEGRNKSIHYVSSVVKVYREALDAFAAGPDRFAILPEWVEELERLDHRPYTTGFYTGSMQMQEVHASKADAAVRVVALVREVLDDGSAVVEVKNPFAPGETLNRLPSRNGTPAADITIVALSDMNGAPLDRAITNRLVQLRSSERLNRGDILRRCLSGGDPNQTA